MDTLIVVFIYLFYLHVIFDITTLGMLLTPPCIRRRCIETDEELLLKQALEMSMQPTASDDEQVSAPSLATRDFSMMSEDEQVAYAMQMSMDPTSGGQSSLVCSVFYQSPLC